MFDNKTLLELAAKAAGIELMQFELSDGCFEDAYRTKDGYWNPLTDDGDALRLAVKLELNIIGHDIATITVRKSDQVFCQIQRTDDPYAATRRAIVRAAAEIGKTL